MRSVALWLLGVPIFAIILLNVLVAGALKSPTELRCWWPQRADADCA